jgi:hypothetical protein
MAPVASFTSGFDRSTPRTVAPQACPEGVMSSFMMSSRIF